MAKTSETAIDSAFAALNDTEKGTPERERAVDAFMAAIDANPNEKFFIHDRNGNGVLVHEGRFSAIGNI